MHPSGVLVTEALGDLLVVLNCVSSEERHSTKGHPRLEIGKDLPFMVLTGKDLYHLLMILKMKVYM